MTESIQASWLARLRFSCSCRRLLRVTFAGRALQLSAALADDLRVGCCRCSGVPAGVAGSHRPAAKQALLRPARTFKRCFSSIWRCRSACTCRCCASLASCAVPGAPVCPCS